MLAPKTVDVAHNCVVELLDYLCLLIEMSRNVLEQREVLVEMGLQLFTLTNKRL